MSSCALSVFSSWSLECSARKHDVHGICNMRCPWYHAKKWKKMPLTAKYKTDIQYMIGIN